MNNPHEPHLHEVSPKVESIILEATQFYEENIGQFLMETPAHIEKMKGYQTT